MKLAHSEPFHSIRMVHWLEFTLRIFRTLCISIHVYSQARAVFSECKEVTIGGQGEWSFGVLMGSLLGGWACVLGLVAAV